VIGMVCVCVCVWVCVQWHAQGRAFETLSMQPWNVGPGIGGGAGAGPGGPLGGFRHGGDVAHLARNTFMASLPPHSCEEVPAHVIVQLVPGACGGLALLASNVFPQ
jgi:hypothetical protein